MNINRNNYEEFFMLYADKELAAADRKTVEAFIALNPDLKHELDAFQQFKLTPDDAVVFAGKELLMKHENADSIITTGNYESFFVLYADDELNGSEKKVVELFVYNHPQLKSSFALMLQAKLIPDSNIVFANKESLYRKEEDERVIPFRWWRIAAAAAVLIIAGMLWMQQPSKTVTKVDVVKITKPVTIPHQPSLNIRAEGKTADTNSNQQPVNQTIVTTNISSKKNQTKNTQPAQVVLVKSSKSINRHVPEATTEPAFPKEEDAVALNTLKGSRIASVEIEPANNTGINTVKAAAASKSVINESLVYNNTGSQEMSIATQAVATRGDNLEVLNTSVDTKNSLRGFFRKASRLINKKNSADDDDSKRKSILVGGFEIAVR